MFKEINIDPRLKFTHEQLDQALNKTSIITIGDIGDEEVTSIQEAFGIAHSNQQEIIPVCINSAGGCAYGLLALIELFQSSKIPIATVISGRAQSAAAILAAFGTPGYRFVAPQSRLMIHEVSSGHWGKVSELKPHVKETDELNEQVYHLLAKQCGKHKDYFLDLIHANNHSDWFMDAEEIVKHNLADEIGMPTFKISINLSYSVE